MPNDLLGWIAGIGIPLIYLIGITSAVDAIMNARTSQGATAWALALISLPFFSLPLYWVFGRARFDDYIQALRSFSTELQGRLEEAREGTLKDWLVATDIEDDPRRVSELRGFQALSSLPFTRGNSNRLLIDGESTFDAIFNSIDQARDYVLAQFYIIRDDDTGRLFKQKLIDAAGRGVRVFLLYDAVGCNGLTRRYLRDLRDAGCAVAGFGAGRRWLRRFRLNFRNHRKIVVTDGVKAYVGGLNVGDEYLGRNPKLSPWRDTHLEVRGPAVQGLQFSFIRDWYYSRQETLDLSWSIEGGAANQQALILASGPDDKLETCALLFTHAIDSAEERIWIATPYFVPDNRVMSALQLAALRGVDVRILMPRKSDSILFKFVPYAYLSDAEQAGVKIFLYEDGFMHQKVFVVDNDYAAVGTANFDNRSFLLNFEVTALVHDNDFCHEVGDMLAQDFKRATILSADELNNHALIFKFATHLTRLMAPVL